MRKITLIIIHCSATPEGRNLDFETCRHDHIHHRLSAGGIPADTRTLEQKAALLALLRELRAVLPEAIIVGHRDLNPQKGCPCFDAVKEYGGL